MEGTLNALIDDLLWPTTEVTLLRPSLREIFSRRSGSTSMAGAAREIRNIGDDREHHDQSSARGFTSEVTRVAREVGNEGKLGGQAQVRGVSGAWKDLTGERQLDGEQPHRAGA